MTALTYFTPDGEFDGEVRHRGRLDRDQVVALIATRALPGKADGYVSGYVVAAPDGERPFVVACGPVLEVAGE